MTDDLNPVPSGDIRHRMATRVRSEATMLAYDRADPVTQRNNGEARAALKNNDAAMVAAPGTFSKGLKHDDWGRIKVGDLRKFVSEINQDAPGSAPGMTPLPGTYDSGVPAAFDAPKYKGDWNWTQNNIDFDARNWESPLAGHTLETNGPDPDDVAMPPAPALGSDELIAEIAEVYAMALIRDIPFTDWDGEPKVDAVLAALNKLNFFDKTNADPQAELRRKARLMGGASLTAKNLFRGSTPGAHKGPYISQFMYAGNTETSGGPETPQKDDGAELASVSSPSDALTRANVFVPTQLRGAAETGMSGMAGATDCEDKLKSATGRQKGVIRYGTQAIPQTQIPHRPDRDHMTDWGMWHDVQNGSNRKGLDYYLRARDLVPEKEAEKLATPDEPVSRFITTGRDIATYVHFDQLYQAYLNACLLLLGEKEAYVDIGLPEGPFIEKGQGHDSRDGFALFGGPHILTLVTECATRALKAVRRQKYNVHLRARPEFLAAAIAADWNDEKTDQGNPVLGGVGGDINKMRVALENSGLLDLISDHNSMQNSIWEGFGWDTEMKWIDPDKNALLPMAFPEGSPMHPAYGAGHATVAGACITMLKAFFEMYNVTDGGSFAGGAVKRGKLDIKAIMKNPGEVPAGLFPAERRLSDIGYGGIYEPDPDCNGIVLREIEDTDELTIQGELDKLAANIAIGRDFAGVHFYTDYYESLRMGERISIGILQEQMLTYREPLSMRLTTFDGERMMLIGTGGSADLDDTPVLIWDRDGKRVDFNTWFARN